MPSGVYKHKENQGFQKGHKFSLLKLSDKTKKRMSEVGKLRIGKKNNVWKGGKPKCEVCLKIIGYGRKRCVKHRIVINKNYLTGKNHPN